LPASRRWISCAVSVSPPPKGSLIHTSMCRPRCDRSRRCPAPNRDHVGSEGDCVVNGRSRPPRTGRRILRPAPNRCRP
jgi:hypothetical protein